MATTFGKIFAWLLACIEGRGGPLARSVGEAFFLLRRRAGLTQGQVAARAGVSVSAISKVEKGLSLPEPPECAKVLEVLGTSLEQLVEVVDALWSTSEDREANLGGAEAGEGGKVIESASHEDGEQVN